MYSLFQGARRCLQAAGLAIAMVLSAGAAAFAETPALVDATKLEALRSIISGFGSAELGVDNTGDPKISGRMQGYRYTLLFFGCKEGKNCTYVLMRAAFQHKLSFEKANDWNRSKTFGRAYRDKEGDAIVELVINLRHGVTKENFEDTIDWFRVVVKLFAEHIGFT